MLTQTAWLDCRKELPSEDGMLVVVFDPTNTPMVWPARWSAEYENFESDGGWFDVDEITYWMPLPKSPKSPQWCEGYKAAEKDSFNNWANDYTHNPYQPTSPWTYPDGHCGPPSKAAVEWEAGYDFFRSDYHSTKIQCVLTHTAGNQTIKFEL